MTEKIFEVSTRFDGHEIEELQQYTEEELFEWVRNKFFDENGDNGTEETEEAQEIFDGGMLTRYEETLKSVIQQKEDEIERGEEEGTFFMDEALIEAEEEDRLHQWQIDYPELCQSLANSETPDYLTKEGTDAFFEAAWKTLVNFWRGKILDEFKKQGVDQEELDTNGEGIEQSILPDVLNGTSVSEAVHDWVEWKKQDLEEREEEDA